MSKKYIVTIGVIAAALGLSACSYNEERPARLPAGHYEHNTNYIDNDGARIENESYTDVKVDENGRRHTKRHSKNTKDPKGLMNKKTTSEHNEESNEQR